MPEEEKKKARMLSPPIEDRARALARGTETVRERTNERTERVLFGCNKATWK